MSAPAERLPPLREDLRIYPSSQLASGAAGWVVLDPVRHRYFQIGRAALELLSSWSSGSRTALKVAVAKATGRSVTDAEIDSVVAFLQAHELVREPQGGAQQLAAREKARQHHWLAWLVHNYLFFKVPLLRPQPWLDRMHPLAERIFSWPLLAAVAALGMLSVALVLRQWETFVATAVSFFTLEGALLYGASLVVVKAVHELGHALMATRYRVRVPSMGIAFMVLAPFLYSDVSDAWRLRSRRQRLAIDWAGILAELMLASLALTAWVFLPDGPLRSIAFVTATTSLVMSLVLNLNPFMRFDGYHILADATGIPNLQTRAMAVGRWLMREVLFDLRAEPPEAFRRRTLLILALYAYSIWIYRFFLFLGIALLVYHMAFKALGIILFVIEIVWFILRPIAHELRILWAGRALIARRRRTWISVGILAAMVTAAAVPWSTRVRLPAVAGAATDVAIHPRGPGRIEALPVAEGRAVQANDVIAVLRSPDLEDELRRVRLRIALLELRRDRTAADATDRSESIVIARQLEAERQRDRALQAQLGDLVLRTPAAGVVRDLDPALKPGVWVGVRTPVAHVVGPSQGEARGYVAEADLRRLTPGSGGWFVPSDATLPAVPAVLTLIGPSAVETVDLPALASVHEGPVDVVADGQKLKPTRAVYPATLTLEGGAPPAAVVGTVVLEGKAESLLARMARQVLGILIREAGA